MESKNNEVAVVVPENIKPEDQPTGGVPMEAPAPKPNRLKNFMAEKFPDREFADDDEFNNELANYVESTDKRLSGYELADETIRRVAASHPEIMEIVEDLAADENMSFAEAVARNLDPEEIYPKEGDPDFEAMRKAHELRRVKCSEAEAYQKKIEANLEDSRSVVQDYFKSREISDADAKSLADYIDSFMDEYLSGCISERALDMFRNAMNYKSDVETAREEGVITAKNAKIDAVRQQKKETTDGLPAPGSSVGVLPPLEPTRRRVIDTAKLLGVSEDELSNMRNKK